MRAHLPGFLGRNLRIKALALLLAVVFWVGVVYAGNPPETRTIVVHVANQSAQLPNGFVLLHGIPDVPVRLAGTRAHLDNFDVGALTATVSYDQVSAAGHTRLPVRVICTDRDVVIDSAPQTVDADIDHLDSRTLPVKVDINPPPPAGYSVRSATPDPGSVTVTGPQSELGSATAVVNLDLSTWKTNLEADRPVILYNGQQRISDLGVAPGTVRMTVLIVPNITVRPTAVVPHLTGSPPQGRQLTAVSVSPATVVLTGPQDLLASLDSVSTSSISLAGIGAERSTVVAVSVPAGVTSQPASVTVTVRTQPVGPPTPPPSPLPTSTPPP